MRFFVTFPPEAGQYAGTHWFFTISSRNQFMQRAERIGVDVTVAVFGRK